MCRASCRARRRSSAASSSTAPSCSTPIARPPCPSSPSSRARRTAAPTTSCRPSTSAATPTSRSRRPRPRRWDPRAPSTSCTGASSRRRTTPRPSGRRASASTARSSRTRTWPPSAATWTRSSSRATRARGCAPRWPFSEPSATPTRRGSTATSRCEESPMSGSEREPETSWGEPVKRVYGPADVPAEGARETPGEFPFTRGIHPSGYRSRLWTMRQYAGFGSAAETNKRYRFLLDQGQTGLSVAFDLLTQMGYDPDHPIARGEVGKVGVSIASLEDMQDLFEGIPLDRVSTSMTINATASILLALYVAVARRQGVSPSRLSGTTQNDILKEYIARGTYIFPPGPSMRLVTDVFAYCREAVPRWNTISISGYHVREAGCTAVQEVAVTLANGIAYVEAARRAGLEVDAFAPQLSFFFNAHNNLIEEIAKFRAARRLWARLMRDRFGARDPRSQTLRFHAQTAGSMLTAQQPENNIVRVTVQALAAVLGGCQSLHTNSMDEALALPTERAVRIALRTQQILAHESGVADTVDALGGSFMIEHLTRDIEEAA